VREPHNSTLSVFARLGMLGLVIWLLFIFLVIRRFVYVIRRRLQSDEMVFRLTLFLFSYFVLAMVVAIVQPALEFSHSDLPFLFLLGVALGMMRWQAEEVRHSSSPMISAHAVRV
jgi:O-antigen ligase